jgi:predicted ATPase
LDDPYLYFFVSFGLWAGKFVAFDGDAALERAQELSRLAEGTNAAAAALLSARAMGLTLVLLGRFEAARVQLERGISVYVPEKHRRIGDEPGAVLNSYHSILMWLLGYPDTAMKDVETALRLARDCKDATMLMYTLFHVCVPEILVGRDAAADAHGQEVLSLAEEKIAPQWRAGALIIRGCTLSYKDPTAGAQLIQTGLAARASTGAVHLHPFFLTQLASAYCRSENFEKARCCISEAFEAAEKTKEKWAEAEIHLKAGELALRLRQTEEAQRRFVRSISIAREQGSKSWELRAAMSMARLWHEQGKRDEARDLLAPVYGWFTEGFDTVDLRQAKTLLDELA